MQKRNHWLKFVINNRKQTKTHSLFCSRCSWEPYFSQLSYRFDKTTTESMRQCCGAVSNMVPRLRIRTTLI